MARHLSLIIRFRHGRRSSTPFQLVADYTYTVAILAVGDSKAAHTQSVPKCPVPFPRPCRCRQCCLALGGVTMNSRDEEGRGIVAKSWLTGAHGAITALRVLCDLTDRRQSRASVA